MLSFDAARSRLSHLIAHAGASTQATLL